MQVPVNRTLGLVLAGDDGQHFVRYGSFGVNNSARSIGHAGAHRPGRLGRPVDRSVVRVLRQRDRFRRVAEAIRGIRLSDVAATLPI